MIYGLIVAAGKQTRFGSDFPKALMNYKGNTLLDLNVENLSLYCDKIFVAVSEENQSFFGKGNYTKLVIDSGRGCGDAVLEALNQIELTPEDAIFVQWGDCLLEDSIYEMCINHYECSKDSWIIPCVEEASPYVRVIQSSFDPPEVLIQFSKYNEVTGPGFHDLSVFFGNALDMKTALMHLRTQLEGTPGSRDYHHVTHGNEMLFLDVFNCTNLPAMIIGLEEFHPISFNTLEEYNNLIS